MAQPHDTHEHDHGPEHAGHSHRDLHVEEAPLDAANQSLADALRASFRLLKGVMLLLLAAFLISGSTRIDQNEQGIVVRFGKPLPGVRAPGLSLAWPFPIDETIRLPVKQLKTLQMATHWPTTEAEAGGGLDPMRDGALLTGDRGLVHVKWNLTYQIENIEDFVRTIADSDATGQSRTEAALENLLQAAAVAEAAAMNAIDVYPRSPEALATNVRVRMNESLASIGTGIKVVSLDIPDSSVPGAAKEAFLNVTREQATKQRLIRAAEQEAVAILNGVAGPAHGALLTAMGESEQARVSADETRVAAAEAEIRRLLEVEVSGDAGATISKANAYYAEVVQSMNADIREYKTLLPEYQINPTALIMRLWSEVKRDGLDVIGLTKLFLPTDPNKEIRLTIKPDPEQKKLDEKLRLEMEAKERERAAAGNLPPDISIGRRRRG